MNRAQFRIAGLVFELKLADETGSLKIPSVYEPFYLNGAKADLSLIAHFDGIPHVSRELVFDSKGPWKLWNSDGMHVLSLHSAGGLDLPYQIAVMDSDFKEGDTYVSHEVTSRLPGFFPFSYPLDECLAINRIARGHGIEVHACGLDDNGKGILFLGVSGSGKSTMSKIWNEDEDVLVLSDDRIIITTKDGAFWIHGTPWHGDAGIADPGGVPLEAIFFIRHAPGNNVAELGTIQSASQLLARSFPTFWNREGMEFSSELTASIAEKVPAYELAFKPGSAVVDLVRGIL